MDLLHYEEKPQTRGGFFWWSVFILLLTGACLASWILSFYVVAHPENPKCYRLLKKLKRLDSPKAFPETQVPRGEFFSVAKLLDRYGKLGPEELARENAQMLRSYLMNFRETKTPPVYVVGKYDVVETHVLGVGDLFPAGAVILAQSKDSPQVLVELVFSAPPKIGSRIKTAVPTGTDVILGRSRDLLALIHAERHEDGRMQFTAVPLPYGAWQVKPSQINFELSSPEDLEKNVDSKLMLDVAAGLPIVRGERLAKGTAAYAEYRQKVLSTAREDENAATHGPELTRYDPNKEEPEGAVVPKVIRPPTPEKQRPPAVPVPAVPLPIRPVMVSPPIPTVPPPNPSVATPAPTVPPVVAPAPAAPAAPGVTVPAVIPPSAPVPATVPATKPPAATPGGAVPRRMVTVREAAQMAGQTGTLPPSVLGGDFIVTNVTGQRVELKTLEAGTGTEPGAVTRVVIDFPTGTKPPAPGSMVKRAAGRGFVIRSVGRTSTGQIVITAAEQAL